MRFWEGQNLKKNLETLAKLKVGEKIGFDHATGRLERHGFGQGIFRSLSGDSVLDKHDHYSKILPAIFQHAAAARGEGGIDTGLIFAALDGLKTQAETYKDKQSDEKKWGRKDAYQQKVRATIALAEQFAPKISGPTEIRENPDRLPDADDRLPSLEEFDRATKHSKRTSVLRRIEFLLQACQHDGRFRLTTDNTYKRFYLYGDLYFTCDYWLKEYPKSQSFPFVERLYRIIVRKLCKSFGVSVNVLPVNLTEFFGSKLFKAPNENPDLHIDYEASDRKKLKEGTLTYLKRAEARKYKLIFKHGVAYQYPWWREERGRNPGSSLVVADSMHAMELDQIADPSDRQPGGAASCVMSLCRDIYMYAHRSAGVGGHATAFYHSSYLAGEPVLCAGGMSILRGRVTQVTLGSGHYRPPMPKMLNWLECLRMHRVDLRGVRVQVYDPRDKQDVFYPAELFLNKRGNVPITSRIV